MGNNNNSNNNKKIKKPPKKKQWIFEIEEENVYPIPGKKTKN